MSKKAEEYLKKEIDVDFIMIDQYEPIIKAMDKFAEAYHQSKVNSIGKKILSKCNCDKFLASNNYHNNGWKICH